MYNVSSEKCSASVDCYLELNVSTFEFKWNIDKESEINTRRVKDGQEKQGIY